MRTPLALILIVSASAAFAQTTSPASAPTDSQQQMTPAAGPSATASSTKPPTGGKPRDKNLVGPDKSAGAQEQQSQKRTCTTRDNSNVNCKPRSKSGTIPPGG